MADKNIQMKNKNGTNWDNLYPITKGSNVIANDGIITFENHLSDYTKHFGYAIDNGTANHIIITLNPSPNEYIDGMSINVKIKNNGTATMDININNLGIKPIVDLNGNPITNLKVNMTYLLIYELTNDRFIVQGYENINKISQLINDSNYTTLANIQSQYDTNSDGKVNYADRAVVADSVDWSNIQNRPTAFVGMKSGIGTFSAGNNSYNMIDSFCTTNSFVNITVVDVSTGYWTVDSCDGYFTITSDKIESGSVKFNYYIIKGA